MQNKLVGDIGDFGKYGLLRYLTGMTSCDDLEPLSLGMAWYVFREEHGGHGNHVDYLRESRPDVQTFRNCDPELWRALLEMVCEDRRCIKCVMNSGILPEGTLHHDDMLYFVRNLPKAIKEATREHWLKQTLEATAGASIVYLDPDNNIKIADDQKFLKIGPKYAYLDDLKAFWKRGQSLVVYHQPGRVNVDSEIKDVAGCIEVALGEAPIPLRFNPWGPRIFFVVPQPEHRERIEERIKRMMADPWGEHFSVCGGIRAPGTVSNY